MDLPIKPLLERRFRTGESPVYDAARDCLLFCDGPACTVYSVKLDGSAQQSWDFHSDIGSVGLARSGRLVVALRDEVGLFDRDSADYFQLARIALPADIRLNDGRVGPDGAFWVGSMHDAKPRQPVGSLFRVTPESRLEEKIGGGIMVSNGLAFSPEGSVMYHSDSGAPRIDRWDFDKATGTIANRRTFATPTGETGRPDGAAVDAEGCYWSAGLEAGRVNRFSPDGRLLDSVAVPGIPTMPCFAGKERRTLVVTTIREGRPAALLEKYPLTGSTFIATAPLAVEGLAEHLFADV